MLADRKTRRDKLIFEAQIPGNMERLSELGADQLTEKIMMVNRAKEFEELTSEQQILSQGLRDELRRRAEVAEANRRSRRRGWN
jgi:hypothetical protein